MAFPIERHLEPSARLLSAAEPRGPVALWRTREWPLCAWVAGQLAESLADVFFFFFLWKWSVDQLMKEEAKVFLVLLWSLWVYIWGQPGISTYKLLLFLEWGPDIEIWDVPLWAFEAFREGNCHLAVCRLGRHLRLQFQHLQMISSGTNISRYEPQ